MKIIFHRVPLHLSADNNMVVSVVKDSCGNCPSVSIYHPLLGADIVKYRLIFRTVNMHLLCQMG